MSWQSRDERRQQAAVRYRNARYLLLERCQGKVARFARALKQSHSYAAAYISEHPSKRIGDTVAQRIEKAFALPTGWLDVERSQNWDSRLRQAIGRGAHPLDSEGVEAAWQQALPEAFIEQALPVPDSPEEMVHTAHILQQRYLAVSETLNKLHRLQHSLAQQMLPLLADTLHGWALAHDYVVESPQRLGGPFFRIWHADPFYNFCLQLHLAVRFEPALEFRPLPPATRDVTVIPYFADKGSQPQFLFIPTDERISPFDIADITDCDGELALKAQPMVPPRSLAAYKELDRCFVVDKTPSRDQ